MATIAQLDVFKFVALRAPKPPKEEDTRRGFIADRRPVKETPVGRLVSWFGPDDGSEIPGTINRFIADHHYELAYPQSRGDKRLSEILSAVAAIPPEDVSSVRLVATAESVLGQEVKAFVDADEGRTQLDEIWDRYEAFFILGLFAPQNLEQLTLNLRVHHLLALLSDKVEIADAAALQAVLRDARPLIDPLFSSVPKLKAATEPPKPNPSTPRQTAEYEALWTDLVDTHRALDEVRRLRPVVQTKTTTAEVHVANQATGCAERAKLTQVTTLARIPAESLEALRPQTRSRLAELRVTQDEFRPPDTVAALTARLERLNSRIAGIADPHFLTVMPREAREIRGLAFMDLGAWILPEPAPLVLPYLIGGGNVRRSIKPLGIGDLKVVKQKLRKYETGEIAHIENVLRGEYKERKHRVLDRTEEMLVESVEIEEETTKDTQTTDRFELKKESEKTIQEQMSVQAGVTVSGSYGMVTFGAHGDFAYSTSTAESNKSASNFAREVIDKSVSRIQKKIRKERVSKTLHEVEELNTHGIDNKGQPDHVTGVYRWVDKYYEAQIYNYGKRLMFEFIVPEPAAFIEYAQTHQPKKDIAAPPALPVTLTHKDITEWNYQYYIRDYMVQGCTPPPPEYKVVTATLSSDAQIANGTAMSKSTKELVVPEGYTLEYIGASMSAIYVLGGPQLKLSIGNDNVWATLASNVVKHKFDFLAGSVGTFDGIVPVSINCYDINSFFVHVAATCRRRDEKYETWQIQTFEKIVAAHPARQTTYQQQLAAEETRQGVVIRGQNPGSDAFWLSDSLKFPRNRKPRRFPAGLLVSGPLSRTGRPASRADP